MDDFEHFLKRQTLRPSPPEWRAEILSIPERDALLSRANALPANTGRFRRLLSQWTRPSSLAWTAVACAWVAITGLNFASRPSASAPKGFASAFSHDYSRRVAAQRELLREMARAETEQPPQPSRPRDAPESSLFRPFTHPALRS